MAPVGFLQKCSAFEVLSEMPKTPGIKSVQQCSSQLHTGQNAAGFSLFLIGMQIVLSTFTATLMNFVHPSGLQLGWGRGWGRWKSKVVPGRVTHLPYFNLHHSVMKCFIYRPGTEGESLGRRRMAWRGEALDVPVTASAGFCELQYFLGCESPLGWVVHYLSLVQGSQEAHLSPFFFSSGNATQCHTLCLIFTKKTLYCAGISLSICCWGQQPQKMPACCLCFNAPRESWADPRGLFIMSLQTMPWRDPGPMHGLDWPRMLWIRVRLCCQSWGLSWPWDLIIFI